MKTFFKGFKRLILVSIQVRQLVPTLVLTTCVAFTLTTPAVNAGDATPTGPVPQMGPVIMDNGPVLPPPPGSYNLDPDTHYKVSIDVGSTAEFPGDKNRKLVSVARFLNMHAQQGIPRENIEFAVIVHGMAANDFLSDEAHQSRFNEVNPNTALLDELNKAGVKVYMCSQTVAFRGMAPEEFRPDVIMSLSAMTAHVRLQHEGYTLIPF